MLKHPQNLQATQPPPPHSPKTYPNPKPTSSLARELPFRQLSGGQAKTLTLTPRPESQENLRDRLEASLPQLLEAKLQVQARLLSSRALGGFGQPKRGVGFRGGGTSSYTPPKATTLAKAPQNGSFFLLFPWTEWLLAWKSGSFPVPRNFVLCDRMLLHVGSLRSTEELAPSGGLP